MAIGLTLAGSAWRSAGYAYCAVYTSLTWAVDDHVIVCTSSDNLTDIVVYMANAGESGGNLVLTQDVSVDNPGDVACCIYSGKVLTEVENPQVRLDLSEKPAMAISIYKVTGLDTTSWFDKSASAVGNGTTSGCGPTDILSQANELAIGAIGAEEQPDEKGTWTTGAGYVSGNDQDAGADSGGAKASTIFAVAEIVSATTAQSIEQTNTGGHDWAACVATYKGAAGGVIPLKSFVGIF